MRYITSIHHISKSKSKVCLSDGAAFILYRAELRRYGLGEEEDLSDELYAQLLGEVFCPRAKKRALHQLERKDYTRAQLASKLTESGYPPEAVEQAVEYVASYGYVDDERFARSYIRFHQQDRSQRRLTQDLLQKGVDRELIAQCLEEEYTTDTQLLLQALLAKKHYSPQSATAQEKSRLYRFLAQRGFASEDIRRALDTFDKEM